MFDKALKFAAENPELVTLAVGVATGAFNWATKKRSREELEAMSPRRAAFHRFMTGLFPDPQKTIEAVWQFWKNTHDRLPPKQ